MLFTGLYSTSCAINDKNCKHLNFKKCISGSNIIEWIHVDAATLAKDEIIQLLNYKQKQHVK